MTVIDQDTFIRANQSGFGTASSGSSWTEVQGIGVLNVVSDQGRVGPGGNDSAVVLGSSIAPTVNILCRIRSGDAGNVAAVLFRYSNTGGINGYRAGIFGTSLILDKYVAGTRSNVGSTSITYNVGEEWWVRAVASGTSITVAAWKDGTSEPAPQLTLTDSSNSTGQFGISVFMVNDFTYFDSLVVTDNQTSAFNMAIQARAVFKVRATQQIQGRAKFLIRLKLQTVARSIFKVRAIQATVARSRFLIPLSAVKVPLSLTFQVIQKLKLAFSVAQKLKTTFTLTPALTITFAKRSHMPQPNSTITSTATVLDATGSPITNASIVAVTVTFPDNSTGVYGLGSGVTNNGDGTYSITYQTKSNGLIREDWKITASDNQTTVEDINEYPVSY